ncbi:MAG: hypothetical protein M3437_16150 [Chloroflexota bacterium]|nr:hypothetical protein [Chloroflexota bacterium]MDQ5866655.1 hypothetical protein [Chloroflexota bacterium]
MISESSPTHAPQGAPGAPTTAEPRDRPLNRKVAGLLLLLAVLFTAPGLPPFRVAAPMQSLQVFLPWHSYYPNASTPFKGGDVLLQQLPWRHWSQDEFAAGRFPLWSSTPTGGAPLFAHSQPGVLHFLHLLWVLMPVGWGLGIVMAIKTWLAGLGMWLFLRDMDLHPAACGITAISFMFSAALVNWLHWTHSNILLLLPWLAWSAHGWLVLNRRSALPITALLVSSGVLAGHPESLFIVGLTTGVWTLALVVRSLRQRPALRLAGLVLAVSLGFLVGMVQIIPFLEAVSLSHQLAVRETWDEASANLHLSPHLLLTWLLPRAWGYDPELVTSSGFSFTENVAYVGIAPVLGLALAGIGVLRQRSRLQSIMPWIVIGGGAFLIAYDSTLGGVLRSLPIFNQSINVRWIVGLAFAVLVIGAFGWHWLAQRVGQAATAAGPVRGRGATKNISLVALSLGTAITTLHMLGLLPQPALERKEDFLLANGDYRLYWAAWALGLLLTMSGACGLWLTESRLRRAIPLAIGLIVVLDLWRLMLPVNGTAPSEQYFPPTNFFDQLKANVPPSERIFAIGDVMPPNSGLVYGVRDWRSSDPMVSQRAHRVAQTIAPELSNDVYANYYMFFRHPRIELPPLLGMRYYIGLGVNNPPEEGSPAFTRLAYKDGLGLWRAEGVPGFAYLSDNVQAASTGDEALSWLNNATWETARGYRAVVEAAPGQIAQIKHDPAGSPGNVVVSQYTSGHIRLRATATRPALLVVAESWYPGWEARLDGQATPLFRANYLSQGVLVPEGVHTIELDYRPASFVYGVLASILGVLGTAGLGMWAYRGRQIIAHPDV